MRHDVVDHRVLAACHAVDGAVGEPGERHGERIDALPLRAPLLGDGLGQRLRRQSENRLAGRPHRLAVEQEGAARVAPILDGHVSVEALRQAGLSLRAIGSALAGVRHSRCPQRFGVLVLAGFDGTSSARSGASLLDFATRASFS